MKSKLLLIFILMCFASQAQNSVKIRKNNVVLFKGQEAAISNWYIYKYANDYYLCPLNIKQDEVEDWFEKRKNSQNIYKGQVSAGQYTTLTFRKDNDPLDKVSFYYKKVDARIELISTTDGKQYTFNNVNN